MTTKLTKADKEAMKKHYRGELKRMEALRQQGVTGRIEITNYPGFNDTDE